MTNERYARGEKLLKDKRPDEYANLTQNLAKTAPDLANYVIEFVCGDVWSRDGIDLKTKAIATISTLATMGAEPQLKSHIGGAYGCGVTEEEMMEVFIQIGPYAGFPRTINAIRCLKEVTEEMKQKAA